MIFSQILLPTIYLSAGVDPLLLKAVGFILVVVSVGAILKKMNQPPIIAYILAGIIIGPDGMALVGDQKMITTLGSFGLILLMFFIGMEISIPQLISNWKISVWGTLTQVILSVAIIWLIGFYLDWSIARIVTLGFVISISSTAVVIKLLKDSSELDTNVGRNAVSILIAQDILVVPMLITLGYLTGQRPPLNDILLQLIGGILIVFLLVFLLKKETVRIPFKKFFEKDTEAQVFISLFLCFGFALATGFFGISTALGAFTAGILISKSESIHWVHESINPFRVLFVAIFFISVGLSISLDFLVDNYRIVLVLLASIFVVNTLINTLVVRLLGDSWRESFYTGIILSQIGEFSFVLGATAYFSGIITDFGYQLIISLISLSLLVSPFFIGLAKKWIKIDVKG